MFYLFLSGIVLNLAVLSNPIDSSEQLDKTNQTNIKDSSSIVQTNPVIKGMC
jgi:hypothetical protein